MDSNTRLVINTLAQNIRTVFNIVLSLFSTRIILQALGQSDYGIYMLVAGIVSLLSYLSNTLVVTTQRHLSYSYGVGNTEDVKLIFANSYLLHWILGLVLAAGCLCLTGWIFNGTVLNIPSERLEETKVVYLLVVVSVLITFVTAPFRALLISHENIVYISIVEMVDGVLKLALAFTLFLVDEWRLPLYGLIVSGIMLCNFILLAFYGKIHYDECIIIPRLSLWRIAIQRRIIGFATWTLYGMVAVYVRNQGLAVALNKVIGTMANAAYGIANQVFGSIQILSGSIINAISPQIIRAEGAGNRHHAIHLTYMTCKYCYLLLAWVSIPVIFEMPTLLGLWLDEVPQNVVLLTDMMLTASLCDQITIGLGVLNQAVGNIRQYTLVVFTTKMLALPLSVVSLMKMDMTAMASIFILVEFASALIRIPLLIKNAEIIIMDYLRDVLNRIWIPSIAMTVTCCLVTIRIEESLIRVFITGSLSSVIGATAILLTSMSSEERRKVYSLILRK